MDEQGKQLQLTLKLISMPMQSNQVPAARDQAGSMLDQYKAKLKSKNFQPSKKLRFTVVF